MALNWNAILSNTKNLNDVLAILRKILALMDSKTDSDVIDVALRDIDELKEEVARLSNLVEHCNCSTGPDPENPGSEDRFIISCTPPEGQQQIILNKVRNTLPFLTFRNITFNIYINGTLAASDVLMLDADAMASVGLQVEDLTGNSRQISIKNKTDERRAFELFPVEEPNFARDTDIELGHVVVEKYSFHFCLAAAISEPVEMACTPTIIPINNNLMGMDSFVFKYSINGGEIKTRTRVTDRTARIHTELVNILAYSEAYLHPYYTQNLYGETEKNFFINYDYPIYGAPSGAGEPVSFEFWVTPGADNCLVTKAFGGDFVLHSCGKITWTEDKIK